MDKWPKLITGKLFGCFILLCIWIYIVYRSGLKRAKHDYKFSITT